MAVDHKHPDYSSWQVRWQKCRDVISGGQEKIHEMGALYLPKLSEEDDVEYNARKSRAGFYEASARTAKGLVGMLFRKAPVVELPKAKKYLLDDINLAGKSFTELMHDGSGDAMEVNRFGLLVDFPSVEGLITKAEAGVRNLRPFMHLYSAEKIINWTTGRVNNLTVLTMVVLKELKATPVDEFESKDVEQFRVLDLASGVYRVRVFHVIEGEDVQVGGDIYPQKNGATLDHIPFYMYPDVDIEKPPLLGLVNMNLSHYNTTADYEHGCHLSGLPTLFITGYTKGSDEKIYIGGSVANILPSKDADAKFVEVQSEFKALRTNLDDKEKRMAVLGSRMLEQQKKAAETAEVASVHRAGEASTLSTTSVMLSKVYTRALQELIEWAGSTEEVLVTLNRDFIPSGINPQLVTALLASVQAGKMSDEAFFENLKRGEMYPDEVDFEIEQGRIDNQSPPLP